jgi:Protein of unknown function (DUF3179)
MKKIFYLGVLGFILFEIANVYFIMPIPGSQDMNSLDTAYFLYAYRWFFRILFGLMVILGTKSAFFKAKWLPIASILALLGIVYATNFAMAADTMFYQVENLSLQNAANNKVENDRLILGISYQGQAKAYPIQYLGYHHQVRDSIGDKPIMVTYCTVCRSGRVFEPIINNKTEDFRLVGMDHFNALFEDKTTKSWWRQATGEAVAGALKGQTLPEYPSMQTTLGKWLVLYPHTLVMQPDKAFQTEYDSLSNYETGKRIGKLTRRDSLSWQDKSWVVGVVVGKTSKAYDWNVLQHQRIIYDELDGKPMALILSKDNNSFVVLQRLSKEQTFTLVNDTLESKDNQYNFLGVSLNPQKPNLLKINAYQEYWQSWRTFHPLTKW